MSLECKQHMSFAVTQTYFVPLQKFSSKHLSKSTANVCVSSINVALLEQQSLNKTCLRVGERKLDKRHPNAWLNGKIESFPHKLVDVYLTISKQFGNVYGLIKATLRFFCWAQN